MGNSTSSPEVNNVSSPQQTVQSTNTLKDTTFRSVLFGKTDVEVLYDEQLKQIRLKEQVDKEKFDSYILVLKAMAQLSRLAYCDSGITREVMLSPDFGTQNTESINNLITELEKKYFKQRFQSSTYPNSKEGRPMESYVLALSPQKQNKFATYVSSPSDMAFIAMNGSRFQFLNTNDLVLCFKGTSSMKNIKHDLQSLGAPADLSTMMPPEIKVTPNNYVAGAFVKRIMKSWKIIEDIIKKANPTRIFVVGHSLGGAYATLCGYILAECRQINFPSVQSVHIISFGSPTVLTDGARNIFNGHLDSGKLTLDRVVSHVSKSYDIIPRLPPMLTHPGFQPLNTEMYPETKTGRAYNLDMIQKVYQKGGVFGIGKEKTIYEGLTKTHMPNRISISENTLSPILISWPHALYFGIGWMKSPRFPGMKNSGFKGSDGSYNTFIADLYEDGVDFRYIQGDTTEEVAPDPSDPNPEAVPTEGASRTRRRKRLMRKSFRSKVRY